MLYTGILQFYPSSLSFLSHFFVFPAQASGRLYSTNSTNGALLYSTLLCSTLLYSTLLCFTLLYSTLLYSTLLYSTRLDSTLLYSTLLYSTLLYSTLLCSTLLYSTLLSSIVTRTFPDSQSRRYLDTLHLDLDLRLLRAFHLTRAVSSMIQQSVFLSRLAVCAFPAEVYTSTLGYCSA